MSIVELCKWITCLCAVSLFLCFTWGLPFTDEGPSSFLLSSHNLNSSSASKFVSILTFFQPVFLCNLMCFLSKVEYYRTLFYMYVCSFGKYLSTIIDRFLNTTILILLNWSFLFSQLQLVSLFFFKTCLFLR